VFQLGRLGLWLAVLIGALGGVGAYTFDNGEGLSDFSTDPRACKNCHVMNDQYASGTRCPHHAVCKAGPDGGEVADDGAGGRAPVTER
jgi:nitrate/TMAO reductase-like tetraheme cytochrome c subunit